MARHPPPPSATPGSTVEREVVARGLQKILRREKLTVQEQQAVARHEKQREEELRWKFYRSIPQKHWREMSGRQTKVLHEQAALYGLPFGAAKIDLPEVVRRLHDLLALRGRQLLADPHDPSSGRADSPALERYRDERARIAQLDRLERESELIPSAAVQQFLIRLASLLRTAGEKLRAQFGPEAYALWEAVFVQLERELEQHWEQEDHADEAAGVAVADPDNLDVTL